MAHHRSLDITVPRSFLVLVALALPLAGCGGSSPDSSSGSGSGGGSEGTTSGSTTTSGGNGGSTTSGGNGGGTTGSGGSASSSTSSSSSGSTTSSTSSSGSTTSSTSSSSSGGTALDPNVSPGGNFDLSGWQLQLPIGSTGSPTFISGSQLAGPTGFTDIYFYTDKTDGAMTFMDPTTGDTTSGSLHPRSELREVTNGWPTTGTNTETVTVAVTEVPSTVTIGQIFQSSPAPSKPLLELQYLKGGKLQILLENTNQGGSATFHPVGTVPDGLQFTYELSLTGTTITVTIEGTPSTFTLPSSFVGESFYFKCGDYDQTAVAGTPGTTPGTVVKIYALNVVHQ